MLSRSNVYDNVKAQNIFSIYIRVLLTFSLAFKVAVESPVRKNLSFSQTNL